MTTETNSPLERDETRFWHPFSDMAAVRGNEFVLSRAEDVWVWDSSDKRYLDATASLWCVNIGHGREEVVRAVAEQMRRLDSYSTFGDYANEPALELSDRLSRSAPVPDARVFLTSGGGDSIDTAAKLARQYWHVVGEEERVHLVSRTNAYHGTHGYGTAVAGIEPNRVGWGPLMGDVSVVAHDSVEAFRAELENVGPERVAAFFLEPVIGAGGVLLPPDGYIEGVAEICREYEILLVVDSVICAFGRLGTWWGIERWDVEPDMIVFAKGVTSGYLPLGGVVVSGAVAEPFWQEPAGHMLRHGPTYAGHPACCAAALANIEILEKEGLLARGREQEGELLAALASLAEKDAVAEVRGGLGLLAAIELDAEVLERNPQAVIQVQKRAREAGVLVRPLGTSVAVSPPLTIERPELQMIGEALTTAFEKPLETEPSPTSLGGTL
jgi:putrescine---pyruvate transaminase